MSVRFSTACAVLLIACAAPQWTTAADWPTWRGPNRDGHCTETGLLTEWPEDGPTLAWKTKGLGSGFSSVAIVDGRLYTMGKMSGEKNKRKGESALICLDAKDGHELWTAPVAGGDPNCTPTVDGDLVYALGRDGELLCAKAKTGEEVWRISYAKDFGGKMMSGWGYSESPLVDGDRLIVTPGAKDAIIAALDKKTGKVVWKAEMPEIGRKGGDGAAYSSVVISEAAGIRQYVQLTGRGVISVNAKDGKFLWGYNAIANGTANIPTPIAKGDYIFCSTGYGTGAALLKVSKKDDGLDAEQVYFLEAKEMQNHHGGMILVGDHIYCGHGHNQGFPLCIEMMTGKAAWKPGRGAGEGSAAILYADGNLYFRYENGTMALVEATPKEYNLRGTFKLPTKNGPSWPHPVIVDGKLYIRDQGDLLVYDVAKQ